MLKQGSMNVHTHFCFIQFNEYYMPQNSKLSFFFFQARCVLQLNIMLRTHTHARARTHAGRQASRQAGQREFFFLSIFTNLYLYRFYHLAFCLSFLPSACVKIKAIDKNKKILLNKYSHIIKIYPFRRFNLLICIVKSSPFFQNTWAITRNI